MSKELTRDMLEGLLGEVLEADVNNDEEGCAEIVHDLQQWMPTIIAAVHRGLGVESREVRLLKQYARIANTVLRDAEFVGDIHVVPGQMRKLLRAIAAGDGGKEEGDGR